MRIAYKYTIKYDKYKHSAKATELSKQVAKILKVVYPVGFLGLILFIFAAPRASLSAAWRRLEMLSVVLMVLCGGVFLANKFLIQRIIKKIASRDYVFAVSRSPHEQGSEAADN